MPLHWVPPCEVPWLGSQECGGSTQPPSATLQSVWKMAQSRSTLQPGGPESCPPVVPPVEVPPVPAVVPLPPPSPLGLVVQAAASASASTQSGILNEWSIGASSEMRAPFCHAPPSKAN